MQKNWLLAIAILFSITNISAKAEVVLNVDENIIVTAINGQEVKNGLFTEPKRTFKLDAGKHVITAKYHRLYDLPGGNHDVLRSSNISLPAELSDNQHYNLVMIGQPELYSQAKEYAKKPTLAITLNDKPIASQQAMDSDNKSIFSGLGKALGNVFSGGSTAVQSNQQTIQALNTSSSSNTSPTISHDTLDQFMQLWLKATPEEREKIRQWVQK